MSAAPYPPGEAERLAALRALNVLDSAPEPAFDALVQAAARVCGTPISLISLVDAERQWFKAQVGLDGVQETPRELSFCAHALASDALLEVRDAWLDPRFIDNGLVTSAPHIRFYAGVPLRLSSGHRAGTLCVIDREPRSLDAAQREVLGHLAQAAAALLELRQNQMLGDDAQRLLAEAHERISLATLAGGIGVWGLDLATQRFSCDAQVASIYGFDGPKTGLSHEDWASAMVPEDRLIAEQALATAILDGEALDVEFRVRRPSGELRYVRSRALRHSHADGRPSNLLGVNWDVSESRHLQQALAAQKELLSVTLQSIGDAVITTDAAGCVQWLNPVAERLSAWPRDVAQGRPLAEVFQLVDEDSREPLPDPVYRTLTGENAIGVAEGLLLARDGREHGIETSVAAMHDADGRSLGLVLVFRDVSEQRRLTREMRYRASHDALTGLLNRGEFELRLQRCLQGTHSHQHQHALLYIDLDQFKLVNDSCGHSAGDRLLQQVARLLGDGLRSRDTLARLGGDEFALIFEHCAEAQAEALAQRICERIGDYRFMHEGRSFRVGTSIGLVTIDKRWAQPEAILQAADRCCYAAKEAGRHRVQVWRDSDHGLRTQQGDMQWTARIGQALDENRFELFAQRLQPLQGQTGGLHAELLLRLRERDGSLITPGAFLPAAERFQLVGAIDRWVLREAMAWLDQHHEAVESLALNLSGQSVGDPDFHAHAIALVTLSRPEVRRRLCIEITETSAITRLAEAAGFIERLHQLGCQVALDDFGAGASSFGYLKNLQVDRLKIDGQFVRRLNEDPLDMVAVSSFLQVAQLLGLETVAEFVERPEVLIALREMGVSYAQGYLVHRPAPLHELLQV